MSQVTYSQLSEAELQTLYLQKGDRQAFFELHQRYKPRAMAAWRRYQPFLFRRYEQAFEDFFDGLFEEGLAKWDPGRANFQTFFVGQVCRRRAIDFARKLWGRYYGEARSATDFESPRIEGHGEDLVDILDTGSRPWQDRIGYSEQDLQVFRQALEREKPDFQALLRLMLYSGPKRFDEKAEVLAAMGFKKKATGWRDTWRRNRGRIADYIHARREKT